MLAVTSTSIEAVKIITAKSFADSRGVFAGIVEIAVIGYALVKGMNIARRRLLLWHQEAVAPSTV